MYSWGGVYLRKLEHPMLEELLELKGESWPATHHTPILNREDQEKWFKSLDSSPIDPKYLVLAAFGTGDISGSFFGIYKIDVDWMNRKAQVAWDVFHSFRGKGLGSLLVAAGAQFCFDVLNLRRIECEILASNLASQKCAKRSGFIVEGVKRSSVYKMGEYIDSLVLGLLYDERQHIQ